MTFQKIYLIKFSKFTSFHDHNFLKLGFTPYKTEQPLPGMKLQEKEIKDHNYRGKLLRKKKKEKMCLLTLDFKAFRS